MYQEDIRLAIDVGSTKVCSVAVRRDSVGEPEVLALNVMPSDAMNRGDLANRTRAAEIIRASVSEAHEQCNIKFSKAYVGISGKHVRSFTGWGRKGTFDFSSGVTEHDILAAVRNAAAKNISDADHLLYATPIAYRIDGDTNFRKPPIGMHPDYLEVETRLVVCDYVHYDGIFGAVRDAGIEPIHGGATIIAESEQMLTGYERDAGSVMIDIGGNDSEVAVYFDGKAVSVTSLPVGGFHFTNDIALSYGIPFDKAEAVKLEVGGVDAVASSDGSEIDPNKLTGDEKVVEVERSLTQGAVSHLLKERVTEMGKMFRRRIQQTPEITDPDYVNVAFTGGGAKINGFAGVVKVEMGVRGKVDVRRITGLKSLPESVSDPSMSGAISVMLRGLDRIEQDNHVDREPATSQRRRPVAPEPVGASVESSPGERSGGFLSRIRGG